MGYEGGNISDLFTDGEDIARAATYEMADAAGAFVTAMTRELAPVDLADRRHVPGSLRDSYQQLPVERTNDGVHEGFKSGVESHDYRARWIESGTKAHPERASIKRAIEFTTISGELVRAYIRNPGIRAQHPVARAQLAAEIGFETIAQPALDRWAERQEAAAKAR